MNFKGAWHFTMTTKSEIARCTTIIVYIPIWGLPGSTESISWQEKFVTLQYDNYKAINAGNY